jgi:hypothetical protein
VQKYAALHFAFSLSPSFIRLFFTMNYPYLDGKSQLTDWRYFDPMLEAELQTISAGYWLLQQNAESALHGARDDWCVFF